MAGEGGPNIEAIFEHARGLPLPERAPYLDGACLDNAQARARVEALLSAFDRAGGFLASPGGPHLTVTGDVGSGASGAEIGEGPGSWIGPYKLLQSIGEGGFGSVFMADQDRPVRRRVALKIIKLGMDTRQVIARFEAERQALAMMDHPNIARVFDAGATTAGRPYFVMELVRGEPITVFCDKNNIPVNERLELFAQVCRAVQHAHTKGVIHRDLKPGNILVGTQDGRSVAKVIDFGIAKATDHRLTEKTVFTEFRQFIGTPEYMSPEQAEGSLDIDTRTDIYSLGVLLYELLTGTTPFDTRTLRSAAYAEIQRIIREIEPPRPSTRLSTLKETLASVAAQRRTEPSRLSTVLRGDLDWIVMKALEKDRARRYDGAGSLAADIDRYLAGREVEAAPPGAAYRARKFVRRHRGPVLAGSLVTVTLVLGLAGTLAGMVRAARDRDRAIASERLAAQRFDEAEKARAESERLGALATARAEEAEKSRDQAKRMNTIASAVTEFFTQDLLDLPPTPEGTHEPSIRDILEHAPAKIERYFSKEPAVAGIIRERVGQIYLNLGDVRKAEEFLGPSLKLLEEGLGPDNPQTIMAAQRLAELCYEIGRLDRAEELFGTLYERRLRVLGPDHNFTWNSLLRRGLARAYQGKNDEAVADAEKAYEEIKARRGETSRPAFIFSVQLIECYRVAGRLEESERLARKMLDLIGANLKEQAPAEPPHRLELALTLLSLNRPQEALAELDKAMGSFEISYPAGHPRLVAAQVAYARALAGTGRPGEARPRLEAALAAYEKTYGATASQTREVAQLLAEVCDQLADPQAAKAWRDRAAVPVPDPNK